MANLAHLKVNHSSSHLILVEICEELKKMDKAEIENQLREYVLSCIQTAGSKVKDTEFLISVVMAYEGKTKTYVCKFAYIWASENVFNILMNGYYNNFTISDLEEEIKKIETQNNPFHSKVSWADISDDDNDEPYVFNFEETINKAKQIASATNIQITEDKKREIWEEKRKANIVKVTIPKSELFKLERVSCRGTCSCYYYDNPKLVLDNEKMHVESKFYNTIVEYISYVKIYRDFVKYPKLEYGDSIYMQFPKDEMMFARKFFAKIILPNPNRSSRRKEIIAKFIEKNS